MVEPSTGVFGYITLTLIMSCLLGLGLRVVGPILYDMLGACVSADVFAG